MVVVFWMFLEVWIGREREREEGRGERDGTK